MNGLLSSADFSVVTSSGGDSSDRGAAISRRFEMLGISDREWHTITGIDRKTLHRAISNYPGTRNSTYDAIEANLDKLEAAVSGEPTTARPIGDPADDLVEISVEGNFGVRAVVKGPVRDIDALRQVARELIADMNRGQE
jgi:hypothetical protein